MVEEGRRNMEKAARRRGWIEELLYGINNLA
jgi:hypothetical protein